MTWWWRGGRKVKVLTGWCRATKWLKAECADVNGVQNRVMCAECKTRGCVVTWNKQRLDLPTGRNCPHKLNYTANNSYFMGGFVFFEYLRCVTCLDRKQDLWMWWRAMIQNLLNTSLPLNYLKWVYKNTTHDTYYNRVPLIRNGSDIIDRKNASDTKVGV